MARKNLAARPIEPGQAGGTTYVLLVWRKKARRGKYTFKFVRYGLPKQTRHRLMGTSFSVWKFSPNATDARRWLETPARGIFGPSCSVVLLVDNTVLKCRVGRLYLNIIMFALTGT